MLVVLLVSRSPAELYTQLGAWHKGQAYFAVWEIQESKQDEG